MRRIKRKSQQGVALLMVLVALTVLGGMTADFMETNEVYLATTVNTRDAVRAEYLARTGVNMSRLLLSIQPLLGKSVAFPFWQYADLAIALFVDSEGGGLIGDLSGVDLSEARGLGLGDGDLEVQIIDEDSKLNVNLANDPGMRARMITQLASLVSPLEYDELFDRKTGNEGFFEREDLICELIDWADPDEDLCDLSGPEDRSVYETLDAEYGRKNAPYDSLQELHMVSGVGDDIWTAFVEPDPDQPDSRVMTVWGKGKVNVNTAPPQVLFPIVCMLGTDKSGISPCMDPMQRYGLLQILQGIVIIRGFMPFSKIGEFISAIQRPEERLFMPIPGFPLTNKRDAKRILTTSSTVFSIYSTASVGKVTKRLHVVVDIEGMDMLDPTTSAAASGGSVLYWRME